MVGRARVGLIVAALPDERLDLCEPWRQELRNALAAEGFEVLDAEGIALSRESMDAAVKRFIGDDTAAMIYAIGTWVDPATIATSIRDSRLPALVVSNPAPASFGFTGASAVHGALDRLGVPHEIVHGKTKTAPWTTRAVPFLKASAVQRSLRQARLGLIGGQSPGQSTGNMELAEVLDVFGVSTIQLDQLLLAEAARAMPDDRVSEQCEALLAVHPETHVPETLLRRSMALRLALEDLTEAEDLTIVSVKCLADGIDICGSFCLAVSLLNSRAHTVSCQCDIPATILMESLRLLSGEPAFFGDLVTLDVEDGQARLINCGACSVSLAADQRSVTWSPQYQYMGKGGGTTAAFTLAPGSATIASMSRSRDGMRMVIALVEVEEYPSPLLSEIRDAWPQGLVQLRGDAEAMVQELRSNHIVLGYGDHQAALVALAKAWGVHATVV